MIVNGIVRDIIRNLFQKRGYQIEGLLDCREIVEDLHHVEVVFDAVQSDPRQNEAPALVILVAGLVLMPEECNPQRVLIFRHVLSRMPQQWDPRSLSRQATA